MVRKKKANKVTKKIVKKQVKESGFLKEAYNVVLKAVVVLVVATVTALSYTGIRASVGADKEAGQPAAASTTADVVSNTITSVLEGQQLQAPAPVPTKVYHIPLKYKYLFDERKKKEDFPKIHLEEAKVLFESGKAVFIDARSTGEYNDGHIPGALSMPVGDVQNKIPQYKDILQDKVLVPYCHGAGCHLSDKVAYALFDAGYKKIVIYFGGWPEWTQANMPVEKYEPPEQFKSLFMEAPSEKEIKQITLEEAKFLYDSGLANFIDVDTQENYNKIHIDRAVTIPVDKLKDMIRGYDYFLKQKPSVIYCHGRGGKAKQAANMLYKEGYKKILIFIEGLQQWEKAGYNLYRAPQQTTTQSR
ncbi:MAG: rhodanese-like domain-containing protein [Candidatus Goldbacteria bacterium]|nr:rhodanese-like domain-containing protein [Candidatus Goldiibacteriota bacterium]